MKEEGRGKRMRTKKMAKHNDSTMRDEVGRNVKRGLYTGFIGNQEQVSQTGEVA